MPRHKAKSKRLAKSAGTGGTQDGDAELLVADPNWVDIADIPRNVQHYHLFHHPRAFYDEMLADRGSWAMEAPLTTAKCVTSAFWRISFPWIVDYQQWRRHVGHFLQRLCSHRASCAKGADERFSKLEAQLQVVKASLSEVSANLEGTKDELSEVRANLEVTQDELNRARGQLSQLTASFRPVQELAIMRPSSVVADDAERIRRAQLRAVSSRSPDPRVATAAMRGVERIDRTAIARFEPESQPGEAAVPPAKLQ